MSAAGWLIDALIASALLMAAVLLVRGAVRRAFGPQVAYMLWALPLLRFFLPSLPAGWWRAAAATPIARAGETITILVAEPAARAAAAPHVMLPPGLIAAVLWAGGAAVFLAWHLLRHRRFCRRVLADAAPLEQVGGIRVFASAHAPGPLAFGVWRRYVAFPRDFAERYDADERALALAHEVGHHQRRDLLANWAALVVLALHWFNPLAWRAFHGFRADQELANDARVLAGQPPAARHVYGRAIVKAAHGHAVSAACHLHTISDLKGRLRMLTISQGSRRRLAAGSAAVTLLVAGGLGLTASGTQAAEVLKASVDEALHTVPVAPPAPPTPLVSPAPLADPVPAPLPPKPGRAAKRVVLVRDGKATTFEGPDAEAFIRDHDLPIPPVPPRPPVVGQPPEPTVVLLSQREPWRRRDGRRSDGWSMPDVPEVSDANCRGAGDPSATVVQKDKDGHRRILICRDRITRLAAAGAAAGANAHIVVARAMGNARESLSRARAAIKGDPTLTDTQRQDGLAEIDQALAEMRDEAAQY